MSEETPVLLSKRKNIQVLLDYCLDQRIAFTATPRAISHDDFEIEVHINGIKQAIALGMFVKENKFEVTGMGDLVKPKPVAPKKADNKPETKAETKEVNVFAPVQESPLVSQAPVKEEGALLSFDLNVIGN
ncbi:MAG: hypothetical protein LW669_04475 [Sphingobacteriales bacterium]|jgi:hypothetical protein|nr:hypothetical protein [Sphingobacteriales bacterium]